MQRRRGGGVAVVLQLHGDGTVAALKVTVRG